jgi:hypothetical protein
LFNEKRIIVYLKDYVFSINLESNEPLGSIASKKFCRGKCENRKMKKDARIKFYSNDRIRKSSDSEKIKLQKRKKSFLSTLSFPVDEILRPHKKSK